MGVETAPISREPVTADIVAIAERIAQEGGSEEIVVPGLRLIADGGIDLTSQFSDTSCYKRYEWEETVTETDVPVRSLDFERWRDGSVALVVNTAQGSTQLSPQTDSQTGRSYSHWPRFEVDPAEAAVDEETDKRVKTTLRELGQGIDIPVADLATHGLFDDTRQRLVVSSADPLHAPQYAWRAGHSVTVKRIPLSGLQVTSLSAYTEAGEVFAAAEVGGDYLNLKTDFTDLNKLTFSLKEITSQEDVIRALGARILRLSRSSAEVTRGQTLELVKRMNVLLGQVGTAAVISQPYGDKGQVLAARFSPRAGQLTHFAPKEFWESVFVNANKVVLEPKSGEPYVVDTKEKLAIPLRSAELNSNQWHFARQQLRHSDQQ